MEMHSERSALIADASAAPHAVGFQGSRRRTRLRRAFLLLLVAAAVSCAALAVVFGRQSAKWRSKSRAAAKASAAEICQEAGALPSALPDNLYRDNLARVCVCVCV